MPVPPSHSGPGVNPNSHYPFNIRDWHDREHLAGDYDNEEAMYCPGRRPWAADYWCDKESGSWRWSCERGNQGADPHCPGCSMTERWQFNRKGECLPAQPERRWPGTPSIQWDPKRC